MSASSITFSVPCADDGFTRCRAKLHLRWHGRIVAVASFSVPATRRDGAVGVAKLPLPRALARAMKRQPEILELKIAGIAQVRDDTVDSVADVAWRVRVRRR